MGDKKSDAESELIVVRCMLGERAAFDELVERWHRRLWRYVRTMVERPDQTEEAVQETWLRVLRGLPRLREPSRFGAWFFGIARRVLMDRLRDKYASIVEEAIPETLIETADATTFDAEDVEHLRGRLFQLPLVERETLTLFYLEGLSLRDVSELTGAPEGTVKSRLHRGRRMLQEAMESKGVLP